MLGTLLKGASAAAAPVEFVSESSASSIGGSNDTVVTAPTGIQDGDLLVAVVGAHEDNAVFTWPSGFVLIAKHSSTNLLWVATKVASSESGNYVFTWNSANYDDRISILVYRNATRVNTMGDFTQIASGSTSTASSITPTKKGVLLATFYSERDKTVSTPPSGMTQRVPASGPSSLPRFAIYDEEAGASSTGSRTIVWDGSIGDSIAFLLQITNEADNSPVFIASASHQNSEPATTLVINKPTGTGEGDLMIVWAGCTGAATWTAPAGWTDLSNSSTRPATILAYKVAGASEPASYTFTSTATELHSGSILTYRNAEDFTVGSLARYGAGTGVLPSISPSESQSVLLALGMHRFELISFTTPAGMTSRVSDSDSTAPSYAIFEKSNITVGPTGSVIMTSDDADDTAAILIAIHPG